MKDDSGNVVYGSITEETKVALEKVAGLYADGLIDPEILVRNDSSEPLLAGKVGIFFGPWWCGYTVGDATLAQEADWQAHMYCLHNPEHPCPGCCPQISNRNILHYEKPPPHPWSFRC